MCLYNKGLKRDIDNEIMMIHTFGPHTCNVREILNESHMKILYDSHFISQHFRRKSYICA